MYQAIRLVSFWFYRVRLLVPYSEHEKCETRAGELQLQCVCSENPDELTVLL